MTDDPKDGYDVGYRKPPKHSRFKKGQPSPNPKGRPKNEVLLSSAIRACLGEVVSVTAKDGTKRSMLAATAIGKRVVGQAASGDISSQRLLLQVEKASVDRRRTEPEQAAPDPEEAARGQHLFDYISNLIHITSGCGMFVVDEEGKTVPSDIGAPLMRLRSDLFGSQIRTAEQYKEARRNALARAAEAFDEYAFDQLRVWQKGLQKSDLA